MKVLFFKYLLLSVFVQSLFAQDTQIKYQDVSQKKMQEQNIEIAKLAAKELSKNLPQKIDKYTTLNSIVNDNSTLIYNFYIDDKLKSDDMIRNLDHSRMRQAVVDGVCSTSKRFLKAGVNISYIYMSSKSKTLLFRFDVTQDKCNYSSQK